MILLNRFMVNNIIYLIHFNIIINSNIILFKLLINITRSTINPTYDIAVNISIKYLEKFPVILL